MQREKIWEQDAIFQTCWVWGATGDPCRRRASHWAESLLLSSARTRGRLGGASMGTVTAVRGVVASFWALCGVLKGQAAGLNAKEHQMLSAGQRNRELQKTLGLPPVLKMNLHIILYSRQVSTKSTNRYESLLCFLLPLPRKATHGYWKHFK